MTDIDGILPPKKQSQARITSVTTSVENGATTEAYSLLETSIDQLLEWVNNSHTIKSHVKTVESVVKPQSMGVDTAPLRTVIETMHTAFVMPGKSEEIASSLRFYVVSSVTWVWFAINTLCYRIYIAVSELATLAGGLPAKSQELFRSIEEIAYILKSKDLKELAFIEWKLSFKLFSHKLSTWCATLGVQAQKFYLAIMVIGSLAAMSITSLVTGNMSLLQNVSAKHALATAVPMYGVGGSALLSQDILKLRKTAPRSFITQHTIQAEDTVAYLSMLYGVKADTITFNNSITTNTLVAGSNVYIPPLDSYINISDKDQSTSDVARIYKVESKDLVAFNPSLANTDSIPKGTATLIPVADFALIKQYQADETNRVSEESKQAELAVFRIQALAGAAYKKVDFLDSSKVADLDFTLPVPSSYNRATTYYGHINNAVDFGTGNDNPDVYSVSGGTVVEVKSGCPDTSTLCYVNGSSDNVFYGNYITVDHGGGYRTRYAHLRSVNVTVGQSVAKGQAIGVVGWSGNSYGKHLHFEVLKDGYGVFPPYVIPSIRM